MSSPKPLLYNPDQKSKQQLIAEFVIRRREFANLMQGLEAATPGTSPQHSLVVGQRGMGKTTLLLRVKYAVEDHPQLSSWLVPIRFSEEQYQIARLDRFWEEIADHLSIADAAAFDGLLGEMEKHEEADDYERIALDLLIRALKKHKKRVLVMVDNLGDLFNKFSDEENHRLREVLLSKTEIQLMGASSMMLEHTFRYDKPFYEFFQQITLEPIGREHALELLRILGKQYGQEDSTEQIIKENPAKIEVLRRLTGGVPRTMALLFGIFIDHRHGTTFEDLQLLVDEVNSLYKHRMDEMKPQQQRIVDALARSWDPISANEVLQRSKLNREGIASNQISAQLKVLTENQVVEPVPGPGKNKTYRIRERFFNIWYLMRYGKKQHKEEVLWLVRFLETWCTKKELQFQAEEQMKALKLGSYSPQAAYYKTMALYHVEGIESSQKLQLLEDAEAYFTISLEKTNARTIGKAKKNELDKFVNELVEEVESGKTISANRLPSVMHDSRLYIIRALMAKLTSYLRLFQIKELIETGFQLDDQSFVGWMGLINQDSDLNEAEKYYRMGLEKGDKLTIDLSAVFYHFKKKDIELAEKYYLMAIEKGSVAAMIGLGNLYKEEKRDFVLAEKYFLMAIESKDVDAMNNLALLYDEIGKEREKIEEYLRLSHSLGNMMASMSLVLLYSKNNNTKEMLKLIGEIINRDELYEVKERLFKLIYHIILKKQYHFLLQLFKDSKNDLMKQARPFYYVLAWFMRDELPGEYEKAGPEIKQTVDEIIQALQAEYDKSEVLETKMKD